MGARGRPTSQKGVLWGSAFSTHVVLCVLLASVVLYALLVTSVHIIIDLMVVILDSNSAPRTCWMGRDWVAKIKLVGSK